MSAEDFQRNKTRKFAIGSVIAVAVLSILGLVIWMTSVPSNARNDFDDASRHYASGKYVAAVEALNSAIAAKVKLPESYQLRATLYRILGEPQKAIDDVTAAIALSPVAENYKIRANAYRETGQYEKALVDYTKLIELQPTAEAYTGRGVCYRELKNPEKALDDFSRSVSLSPSVENLIQRGMAYAAVGKHKEAIADYDAVIDLRPRTPYAYRARAYARDALGLHKDAEADRQVAQTIEGPNDILSKK